MSKRAIATALIACGCACATAPAPDLPTTRVSLLLHRTNGKLLSVAELRGKIVLLTVISTWADAALLEVPRLKAIHGKHKPEDLQIVTVVLDDMKMAKIFAETFEIPYVVAISDNPADLTSKQGPLGAITVMPTSYLIDRQGHIAARMEGLWPEGVLEDALDRLVASDPPGP